MSSPSSMSSESELLINAPSKVGSIHDIRPSMELMPELLVRLRADSSFAAPISLDP